MSIKHSTSKAYPRPLCLIPFPYLDKDDDGRNEWNCYHTQITFQLSLGLSCFRTPVSWPADAPLWCFLLIYTIMCLLGLFVLHRFMTCWFVSLQLCCTPWVLISFLFASHTWSSTFLRLAVATRETGLGLESEQTWYFTQSVQSRKSDHVDQIIYWWGHNIKINVIGSKGQA